ncbi:MAG: hypothetical protein WCK47_11805 [bacterium]|nr:hypothetical protein [Candidatus Sumerlaeota bacterium]
MIRRLLYHFFWNFYDYLGGYLLTGAATTAAVFLLLIAAGGIGRAIHTPWLQLAIVILVGLGGLAVIAAAFAGIFCMATRAARDEAARLPHFWTGARTLFRRCLVLLIVAAVVFVLVAANVVFYLKLGGQAQSSTARAACFAVSMLFLWIGFGMYAYLPAACAALARFDTEQRLRTVLRKGFMLFAIAPMLWFFASVFFLALAVLCVISVLGMIFLIPLYAALATSALDIAVKHAEYLSAARNELGERRQLSAYRRRAVELAWEWEYRQPRRTFRELIRPWEMKN